MSRTKLQSKLIGWGDSDSDDEELSFDIIKSRKQVGARGGDMAATKKSRGRPPAANKVTKPVQKSTRRASGRIAAATSKETREALTERSNNQPVKAPQNTRKIAPEDDEMIDALVDSPAMSTKPAAARGRPRGAKGSKETEEQVIPGSVAKIQPPIQEPKRGRKTGPKSTQVEVVEIPETQQPEAMDIDVGEDTQFEVLPSHLPPAPFSAQRVPHRSGTGEGRRLGNASSVDTGDPQLRRRLGETTKKVESLELKYRDLRDIGIKEAERNFDRLKKQGEDRANAASQLISDLKADLAIHRALSKQGQEYKQQLETTETRVSELNTALSEARAEIKTLSTKLAASRSGDAANSKVPGSAVKGGSTGARTAANSELVQHAQMKEDLYGDLTGLIVRAIKRDAAQDVYDCIQTGRNGTLHFKLAVENDRSGENYEDVQFTYKPQLDANRDRDLIETLPDYLVEDITFPRPHAAKFYARVTKSLTERLE